MQVKVVGGKVIVIESEEYTIQLHDEKGCQVQIIVYGIKEISTAARGVDERKIATLFPYIEEKRTRYPKEGNIDILIGYQYAAFHPQRIDNNEHLLLLENRFGYAVGGSHTVFQGYCNSTNLVRHATVLHIYAELDTLNTMDGLGVTCIPKCGSCKCGTCHPGGKAMSIKEEEELKLIESKIVFQPEKGRFCAGCPWIRDPKELPRNDKYAKAMLRSTEKRLHRDRDYANSYQRQLEDMVERGAARKVSEEEFRAWTGPKFYIAHHAVMKPDSKSTPIRIVFDSSRKHNGASLNDFFPTGPTFKNELLGILFRFRENRVGFIGDIHKMFHSIDIPLEDQMVHLFLWRDMEQDREPDVYAITKVNMGNKPSAAIAQTVLRKTAEMAPEDKQEAADIIVKNSYMDDIAGSLDTLETVEQRTDEMDEILEKAGFHIKEWLISGRGVKSSRQSDQHSVQKLLKFGKPITL